MCVCTGSEWPRRYCHLANDFGSRRIFIFLNRLGHRGMSPELSLSPARSGSPPKTWFPGSTRVQISNGISIGSSILYGSRVCPTHTDTSMHRPCTDIGNNSPHRCTLCKQCKCNTAVTDRRLRPRCCHLGGLSARKLVPGVRWPATGITAHSL